MLNTPKTVSIDTMGSGQFWYNGLENCLSGVLSDFTMLIDQQSINLNFHVDGLPINKSSRNQFWPILTNISNLPSIPPQVVAIYYGDTKPPSANEFLQRFAQELNDMIKNGITVSEYRLNVKINAIICDTPARSFIKCKLKS